MRRTRSVMADGYCSVLLALVCLVQLGTGGGPQGAVPAADAPGAFSPPARFAGLTGSSGPGGDGTTVGPEKALTESLDPIRDLSKKGDYAGCEAGARRLLSRVEAASGPESRAVEQVLEVLVQCLYRGGKAAEPETMDLALRGLKTAETQFGKDSLEAAINANNLGNVYFRRGDLAATRPQWERVLAIREKALGPGDAEVGAALNNMAILAEQTGDYPGSKAFAERSVAVREKALGPDHPDVASSLGNLGTALGRLGDFDGERRAHERALAILEKALGPEHLRVASTLEALCKTDMDGFDLAAARTHCGRAVAIREKILGPDHPDVAFGLDNLALVLGELGDSAQGAGLLERALAIQERAYGPEHPDVAYTLENLALARSRLGRPEEAKQLYLRALPIEEKTIGPEHPRLAEILSALARVYVELGDDAAARPLFERALKILETAGSPDDPSVTDIVVDLGGLESRSGHLDAAERLYRRALSIREKYYGPDQEAVAIVLQRLIPLDRSRGDVTSLLAHSLRAAGILREHFRRMAQGLSEREALRYRENLNSSLDDALSVLASDPARAASSAAAILDEVIRSRAVILDEMAARNRSAAYPESPEGVELAGALRKSRSRLARIIVHGPDPAQAEPYREQLSQAEKDEESAERDLAAASRAFRVERIQSHAGLEEVKGALPPHSVLIAYVQYHRPVPPGAEAAGGRSRPTPATEYLAFVLRAGTGEISVVPLGEAKKIDSLVEAWRSELRSRPPGLPVAGGSSERKYRKAAGRLREAAWDPVAAHLAGRRLAFIVPDGTLNLVSLATLPADGDRFLAETGPTLHYLSAERDLVLPSPPGPRGQGLLAIGGPDFQTAPGAPPAGPAVPPQGGAGTPLQGGIRRASSYRSPPAPCADFKSLRFDPLPGAAAEVSEIDSLWSRIHKDGAASGEEILTLTGAAAGEAPFKQKAPGSRVIHLATHGFFLGGQCGSMPTSSRTASPAPSGTAPSAPAHPDDNPLLLSGLALAGANRRAEAAGCGDCEDGILTAEEIASLNLSGVEWAVLSGCDTGAGKVVSGEGVLGLRRAFQVAGAGTLIMSLWRVEDAAAREWMGHLYEARGEGLSTAESVRKASRETLQARRAAGKSTHPFYWGAFVAAGDWR